MEQTIVPAQRPQTAPAASDSIKHLGTDSLRHLRHRDTASAPSDTTALALADSTQLSETDSMAQPWFAADSIELFFRSSEIPAFRYAKDPSEVFGSASTAIATTITSEKAGNPRTNNPVFQGFVLLLAATYIVLLYRHSADIVALFSRILRTSPSGNRFADEQGGLSFSRFLHITAAIGALFIGVIIVKTGDILMPAGDAEILTEKTILTMSLLATVAFSIIGFYQISVLRVTGALTLSQSLTSQLILLKRISFALMVVVISPILLLYALCPPETGRIWLYMILVEFTIMALLYTGKTLNLFLSKKVSILHWFLYLCTIEIFPISLLWLIATR